VGRFQMMIVSSLVLGLIVVRSCLSLPVSSPCGKEKEHQATDVEADEKID
jgi:hypothetical protein